MELMLVVTLREGLEAFHCRHHHRQPAQNRTRLPAAGSVVGHMVGALVFAVWTMTAVFKSVPETLEEAAINLGASRFKSFYSVSLPLATPGIIASTLLVFLYSLDEFTGTLLVGSPFVLTLPVYMYRTSVGYELQVASISALLLMVPGIVLLVLLERYMKSEYLSMFGRI